MADQHEAMRGRARRVARLLDATNFPRKVVTQGAPDLPTHGDPMDDWLLASYGYADFDAERGGNVYVTTDRVRASETRGGALDDARWDAESPTLALALARDVVTLLDALRDAASAADAAGCERGRREERERVRAVLRDIANVALNNTADPVNPDNPLSFDGAWHVVDMVAATLGVSLDAREGE